MKTFWYLRDGRKETLQKSQAAKQKKRTDNIASRNEKRKDKRKGIKPPKTGHAKKGRPGFEGGRSFSSPSKGKRSNTKGK